MAFFNGIGRKPPWRQVHFRPEADLWVRYVKQKSPDVSGQGVYQSLGSADQGGVNDWAGSQSLCGQPQI